MAAINGDADELSTPLSINLSTSNVVKEEDEEEDEEAREAYVAPEVNAVNEQSTPVTANLSMANVVEREKEEEYGAPDVPSVKSEIERQKRKVSGVDALRVQYEARQLFQGTDVVNDPK